MAERNARFESPAFLLSHIADIFRFYEPCLRDPAGGFFHAFRDDGTVYDRTTRHLVSSARFVFNYANGYRHHGIARYRDFAAHGIEFLWTAHHCAPGHFAWQIGPAGIDERALCYGHAFVLLAGATAASAGMEKGRPLMDQAWHIAESCFWDEAAGAYGDERDATLGTLDPYRGQNANMHMAEACLACFVASGEARFLKRASRLADRFAYDLAAQTNGMVWEHFSTDWQADFEYNRGKPNDLFKPWGFQTGHQLEWARLLVQIDALEGTTHRLARARALYDAAFAHGLDTCHGGLVYGFAPDGAIVAPEKYFWVHAEAVATAWQLYKVTGNPCYRQDYQRIWEWSDRHLVDHRHGAWYRVRTREGGPIDDLKSPPGKTDYHTLGACWSILENEGCLPCPLGQDDGAGS